VYTFWTLCGARAPSSSETALQTRDLEREHGEFGESGDTSWITIAETFVHTDKPGNQQDSEDLLPQYSFNDTLESENSKRHTNTTTQEQHKNNTNHYLLQNPLPSVIVEPLAVYIHTYIYYSRTTFIIHVLHKFINNKSTSIE